jgi:hypothetical protein
VAVLPFRANTKRGEYSSLCKPPERFLCVWAFLPHPRSLSSPAGFAPPLHLTRWQFPSLILISVDCVTLGPAPADAIDPAGAARRDRHQLTQPSWPNLAPNALGDKAELGSFGGPFNGAMFTTLVRAFGVQRLHAMAILCIPVAAQRWIPMRR